jgi:hypothetical protein
MICLIFTLMLALSGIGAGRANAHDTLALPVVDVDGMCAEAWPTFEPGRYKCIYALQDNYNVLKMVWLTVPDADKTEALDGVRASVQSQLA